MTSNCTGLKARPQIAQRKKKKKQKTPEYWKNWPRLEQLPAALSQRGLVNTSVIPLKLSVYLRSKNQMSAGSWKKQESSRKTSISALLTMPKPLTVWITINCGKFWKRWEYQTTWAASWETYKKKYIALVSICTLFIAVASMFICKRDV